MSTNFPTTLDDVDSLLLAKDMASSTLSSALTAVATSLALASGAGFPTTTGILRCEDELIKYVSRSSNTFSTLTRGYNSTAAVAHSSGATVALVVSEDYHNNLKDAIIQLETLLGITGGTTALGNRKLTQDITSISTAQWGRVLKVGWSAAAIGASDRVGDGVYFATSAANQKIWGCNTAIWKKQGHEG